MGVSFSWFALAQDSVVFASPFLSLLAKMVPATHDHQAHRYRASKAMSWMTKNADGDVVNPDLLLSWVATLPNLQETGVRRLLRNKHGAIAEHYIFKTKNGCPPESVSRWHGTCPHCVHAILQSGLANPYDTSRQYQDFIEAGIYTTDRLTKSGALWHATPTRFTPFPDDQVPHTRTVLKVACRGRPIAQRSYGDCLQVIYDASHVVVMEIHCFRGLGFYDKGDKLFDCLDGALAQQLEGIQTTRPKPFTDVDVYNEDDYIVDTAVFVPLHDTYKPKVAWETPKVASEDWSEWEKTISPKVAWETPTVASGDWSAWEKTMYPKVAWETPTVASGDWSAWEKTVAPKVAWEIPHAVSSDWSDWDKPVIETNIEKKVDEKLVEWMPGDKWSWDINFRCHLCHIVQPLKHFPKSAQKYAQRDRKCKACAF